MGNPVAALGADERSLLARARLGMLALSGSRGPLVNPAVFRAGGGMVWMTTSRHAAKVAMAERDPRASFLVAGADRAVLLRGHLETIDPLRWRSAVEAALEGPRFGLNLAGYALKNASYVGGYLLDLPTIPVDWWPQNRVLLRLHTNLAHGMRATAAPPARPAALPGVPAAVARTLAREGAATLCWMTISGPVMAPALWALDGDGAAAWLPSDGIPRPCEPAPAALVVERRHRYRASQQRGVCLRGRLVPDPAALVALSERYGFDPPAPGRPYRVEFDRATWWRGFEVATTPVRSRKGVPT